MLLLLLLLLLLLSIGCRLPARSCLAAWLAAASCKNVQASAERSVTACKYRTSKPESVRDDTLT